MDGWDRGKRIEVRPRKPPPAGPWYEGHFHRPPEWHAGIEAHMKACDCGLLWRVLQIVRLHWCWCYHKGFGPGHPL